MKPANAHQEILLFTDTQFSKREFCNKEREKNTGSSSSAEELENACWTGMLWELLPELMDVHVCKNQFIWQITNGQHFLKINIGSYACQVDQETTLDPYFFHLTMNEN